MKSYPKLCLSFFSLFTLSIFTIITPAYARFELPSSPNPVGSGARALGIGAFIGVADDATSASWNPGGLIQVKRPELSVVGAYFHRSEDNAFGLSPEVSGNQWVGDANINYFSATYPFNVFNRNMVVSLNYQHLYDFNRDWSLSFRDEAGGLIRNSDVNYEQDGRLSAMGLAYAIQVTPQFSLGFTLNFWNDWFSGNEWKQTEIRNDRVFQPSSGQEQAIQYVWESKYSFEGFNANLGMMWNINEFWTIGAVFKSPFTADLVRENSSFTSRDPQIEYSRDDGNLEMPMSYGIGAAWHPVENLTVSADIYRTEWGDFIYEDSQGNRFSMVTGRPEAESDIDPTHQVRVGAEYLFLFPEKGYVVPLRGGLFYDPAPAEGNPDDFYGFSLGTGFAMPPYIFDIAYQYRFGRDVNEHLLPDIGFSQDVDEHTIYISFIYHF